MAHFNNGGARRGGSQFGKGGPGRGGFGHKSWGNDRGNDRGDRPMTMHKAICADCGKECEVPFRPVGGKPVYCKDCFGKREGRGGDRHEGADRFPRRDFHAIPPTRTSFQSEKGNDEVRKQLEALNAKIDRLISAVESIAYKKPASLKEIVDEVSSAKPKKAGKKK